MKKESVFLSALFILLIISHLLHAQEWEFIKEKDGIKVYTRSDENSPVKAYKGETYINTRMDVLSRIIEDVEGFKDWDEDIEHLEMFEYIEDSLIRYYIVYKVQWPFDKRDLYVEAKIAQDPLTGKRTVFAVSKEGVVDEKPGIVRLKNYWQRWTLEPAGDGRILLIQEGSVDPGGSIPAWLANMVITDTPLNIMQKVKEVVARQ